MKIKTTVEQQADDIKCHTIFPVLCKTKRCENGAEVAFGVLRLFFSAKNG